MGSELQTKDLRAFVATVRSGSISRAAVALKLSQPTVSQRIQRLERTVGDHVFVRQPRGATLTPAGEKLLAFAERILALHEEVHTSLTDGSGPQEGRRAIGLLEDLAMTTLPTALADFAMLHPRIELKLVTGSAAMLRRLADRGQLDLVFGDPSVMAESSVRWRRQAKLIWASAPAFNPYLEPLPLVLFSSPCRWRQPVLDAIGQHGRRWRVAFQSNSVHAVQAAISAGIGVGALLAANLPPATVLLSARHNMPPQPVVDIALARRAGTEPDPVLNTLERVLKQAVDRSAVNPAV